MDPSDRFLLCNEVGIFIHPQYEQKQDQNQIKKHQGIFTKLTNSSHAHWMVSYYQFYIIKEAANEPNNQGHEWIIWIDPEVQHGQV